MFIIIVGGGKVGYYLAKSLISSHHEVAIMEPFLLEEFMKGYQFRQKDINKYSKNLN